MAEERYERLERLARMVLASRSMEARHRVQVNGKRPPYYMMFVDHPAVKKLFLRWRARLPQQYPAGDLERTVFELSVLNDEAIAGLEEVLAYVNRTVPEAEQYRTLEG